MGRDWSVEGSPGPADSRARGMRVTWADSPAGSRPDSRLQEVDTLRAQTPPLAGEWAVSRGAESKSQQMSSSSSASHSSSMQASQSAAFSSSQQMTSSQHMSSSQQMSSSQTAASFSSSSQKSSFSQSTSSSFQSSSIEASKAFEAFPGMGGIENLKLDQ